MGLEDILAIGKSIKKGATDALEEVRLDRLNANPMKRVGPPTLDEMHKINMRAGKRNYIAETKDFVTDNKALLGGAGVTMWVANDIASGGSKKTNAQLYGF